MRGERVGEWIGSRKRLVLGRGLRRVGVESGVGVEVGTGGEVVGEVSAGGDGGAGGGAEVEAGVSAGAEAGAEVEAGTLPIHIHRTTTQWSPIYSLQPFI